MLRLSAPEAAQGERLDRFLATAQTDLSRNRLQGLIREGRVRVNGAPGRSSLRLRAGDAIEIEIPSRPLAAILAPEAMALDIVFEDEWLLVVNKPPGVVVHPGAGAERGTLVHALLHHAPQLADVGGSGRPGIVHRLDKDTSGVLLVARTPRAAAFFAKSFSGRTARKVYWAIVTGVPAIGDGMIELPLAKQPGTGGEKMHVDEAEGLPAKTRYRVIERAGNRAAWVELQPHTGRTHQLRVHMAAIGHPILGDGKYGGQDAFLTGAISRKLHLHARRLRIDHPDGEAAIDVAADLPEHFAATMTSLGFDPALGELPLDEVKFSETAEGKRKAASAAAKARRKERRGERRSRRRG
jgi:23S rRNA pseudouridine955/2504/2580 synthase